MPEETKEIKKLRQLSLREMLVNEFNAHLLNYAKQLTELKFLEGRPADEIVMSFVQPSGQPGMPGLERKIKAKEAQTRTIPQLSKEESILKVIQKLIKEEDKKETKFE